MSDSMPTWVIVLGVVLALYVGGMILNQPDPCAGLTAVDRAACVDALDDRSDYQRSRVVRP